MPLSRQQGIDKAVSDLRTAQAAIVELRYRQDISTNVEDQMEIATELNRLQNRVVGLETVKANLEAELQVKASEKVKKDTEIWNNREFDEAMAELNERSEKVIKKLAKVQEAWQDLRDCQRKWHVKYTERGSPDKQIRDIGRRSLLLFLGLQPVRTVINSPLDRRIREAMN